MSVVSQIVVTQFDHDRLSRLLVRLRREGRSPAATGADMLEDELDSATIVDPQRVPPTVVTMNSEIEVVFLDNGHTMRLTVVFPGEASPKSGRISVLAPLGLALLGARVGDEIEWTMPGGPRRLRVGRIHFQPEAQGLFAL
jgi:regulator of nucleoside diphosphate kinase